MVELYIGRRRRSHLCPGRRVSQRPYQTGGLSILIPLQPTKIPSAGLHAEELRLPHPPHHRQSPSYPGSVRRLEVEAA